MKALDVTALGMIVLGLVAQGLTGSGITELDLEAAALKGSQADVLSVGIIADVVSWKRLHTLGTTNELNNEFVATEWALQDASNGLPSLLLLLLPGPVAGMVLEVVGLHLCEDGGKSELSAELVS